MGISDVPVVLGTVADLGLDYLGFAGKVTRQEALNFAGSGRPAPVGATRWITVFHPGADLSALDMDCMLEMKARMKPRIARAQAEQPFQMILVAGSANSEPIVARWRELTSPDPTYASNPEVARSIDEACEMHGFNREQRAVAVAEIERDLRDALSLSGGRVDSPASQ